MAKTRALRLTDQEERLVSQFLSQNPIFDFSSLARTAILEFIKNPTFTITPVVAPQKKRSRSADAQ